MSVVIRGPYGHGGPPAWSSGRPFGWATSDLAEARRRLRPPRQNPVRIALLDLLAEVGTATSTQAAARLGHSSGLCSFHLRQLARHGLIEEAPHSGGGRVRPWRLRWDDPRRPPGAARRAVERSVEFDSLFLTPDEARRLADSVRELLAPYARRSGHPEGAVPVSAIMRLRPAQAE
ncbi:helix-turn-helix domain-containing protein [Streptomyces beihaiensis]|uniref:Helix-turn-helix domain-containing protein n=1 Tax=Streptomyces beihaiensis TaxID=2984495 RepID=A0ABT3U6T3_9ACTN|nr:helix-turn-helix domain-containing protein [Streptomyces beihaiensis]MCX3063898.1 helix-turn-helix domain-containing protein [Streptomyces beihaiensis]